MSFIFPKWDSYQPLEDSPSDCVCSASLNYRGTGSLQSVSPVVPSGREYGPVWWTPIPYQTYHEHPWTMWWLMIGKGLTPVVPGCGAPIAGPSPTTLRWFPVQMHRCTSCWSCTRALMQRENDLPFENETWQISSSSFLQVSNIPCGIPWYSMFFFDGLKSKTRKPGSRSACQDSGDLGNLGLRVDDFVCKSGNHIDEEVVPASCVKRA